MPPQFGVLQGPSEGREVPICLNRSRGSPGGTTVKLMMMNCAKENPPTPCLWQAPASTEKTKRKPGWLFVGARGGGPKRP